VVDEAALARRSGDRLLDLRDHPLQRDFWWGSAAFEAHFGLLNINEILQRICVDFGIRADFSRPVPLRASPVSDLARTILLVDETDGVDKRWPIDHWAAVATLLSAEGYAVAHVSRGNSPSPLDVVGIPALIASTPAEAVDVLSGCRGVIGVDTGLTHIAVQQSTPTVTICRRRSVYVRPWPHCAALRGAGCTEVCMAAELGSAYNQVVSLREFQPSPRSCPSGSPCLAGTRPEDAATLLLGIM
jgi:hypothetical protein